MTPREELLSTRQLGQAGAELLYKTVWLVATGNGFPPPEGSASWNETAVTETAHDFVKDERGRKRLLDIAVRSVDERSFERLLETAVLNFLRDIARGTDFGKLIVRVKEILRDENEFHATLGPPERWTLTGGPTAPGATSPDDLMSATAGVEVVVPKWTSERRDAPLADRPSFVRLMTSVLTAAGGSLTAVDIARALTARLDHRKTPHATMLDIREGVSEPAQTTGDPATRTVAELHAVEIFNGLSDRERIIIPTLDRNVRDLARLIGTGRTQAAFIRQRLIDRLGDELADDDDPDSTATVLCDLCDDWLANRTGTDDATSRTNVRNERGDNS
ncbi:hypothetical protein Psi02_15340 [Planotetraspora silvatica]|uniref:Uncharacterized protein n=1 Tax=Planotetraspora silvatica TaxID=234614 RepID=A0A8J3XLF6_9ACTN|nr:hypothetical protein [Planotetraspora silvatica]GII45110.1 hypothetical protein Psi02_15340 [Planotetraspora silvatica]